MKKIVFLIPAMALAVSCASLKAEKSLLADPSIRESFEPFSLSLGFDVFMLRIDLRRGTHEGIEFNTRNEMQKIQMANKYHPLVVDLGGGLILDHNNNLCLDLLRLYGVSGEQRYRVVVEGKSMDETPSLVERNGEEYRIERSRGSPKLETGKIADASAMDDKNRFTIASEGAKVVSRMPRMGGAVSTKYLEKKTEGLVVFPGLMGESGLGSLQGNVFSTADFLKVRHLGDRIEFGGNTLIRTERSIFLFDRWYHGFELRRDGNEVEYLVNGRLVRTYRLTLLE